MLAYPRLKLIICRTRFVESAVRGLVKLPPKVSGIVFVLILAPNLLPSPPLLVRRHQYSQISFYKKRNARVDTHAYDLWKHAQNENEKQALRWEKKLRLDVALKSHYKASAS